jgi:hypothetical protein
MGTQVSRPALITLSQWTRKVWPLVSPMLRIAGTFRYILNLGKERGKDLAFYTS